MTSQHFSVRWHAHLRLTVRVIRHDLAETEKRGVNYIASGNLPWRHIVLCIPRVRIFNRWKEQSTFKFFTLEITCIQACLQYLTRLKIRHIEHSMTLCKKSLASEHLFWPMKSNLSLATWLLSWKVSLEHWENAVLTVLFSLFLEGVEPNLWRHVRVKKPSHFPNVLNVCLFLNIKSFSGIIKLPKNV